MSPTIRGKRVSSMRMPTLNPYWLKPPRTRPVVMRPNFTLCYKERRVTPPLRLSVVLPPVIAGYGMFLLVATLGTSRAAAVFAAVAFAFSGWTLAWLGRTNIMAEIWMPWMFWAAERVLRGAGAASVGALALFTGFACLSSHPQTGMQILAVLAAYVAVRVGSVQVPARARAGRVALVAAAVVVGVAIALVQLLPMAALIARAEVPPGGRSSARAATGVVSAAWSSLAGDWTTIRRDLPTAV